MAPTLSPKVEEEEKVATRIQFDSKYARKTLLLFGLIVLTVFYVEIMMAPSTPKILLEYKVTLGQTSLILALYTVFGVALTPIVGKLGDIYGKKKVLSYVLLLIQQWSSLHPSHPILPHCLFQEPSKASG